MAEADQGPERWPPPPAPDDRVPMPGWGLALARGLAMRCPACGRAGVFRGFMDIKPVCPHCAAPLGRVRLELLPSYLTILLGLGVMGAVMIASALLWRPGLVRFIAVFVPRASFSTRAGAAGSRPDACRDAENERAAPGGHGT